MLLGGDEFGRTQQGNNNAYCQDNEISWFDWSARRRRPVLVHAPSSSRCARPHPVLRRRRFLTGTATNGDLPDLAWFRPDGERMADADWGSGTLSIGAFFNGDAITERAMNGEEIVDQQLLSSLQLLLGAGRVHAARRLRRRLGGGRRHRRRPTWPPPARVERRGDARRTSVPGRWWC